MKIVETITHADIVALVRQRIAEKGVTIPGDAKVVSIASYDGGTFKERHSGPEDEIVTVEIEL